MVICLQFVAHPNCQQHLTSVWYGPEIHWVVSTKKTTGCVRCGWSTVGPEMGFMQSLALGKKMIMWLLGIPLVPIFCVIYIVSPKSKVFIIINIIIVVIMPIFQNKYNR